MWGLKVLAYSDPRINPEGAESAAEAYGVFSGGPWWGAIAMLLLFFGMAFLLNLVLLWVFNLFYRDGKKR